MRGWAAEYSKKKAFTCCCHSADRSVCAVVQWCQSRVGSGGDQAQTQDIQVRLILHVYPGPYDGVVLKHFQVLYVVTHEALHVGDSQILDISDKREREMIF